MRDLGSHAVLGIVVCSECVSLVAAAAQKANVRNEHINDEHGVRAKVLANACEKSLHVDSGMQVNQRVSRDEDESKAPADVKITHVRLCERNRNARRRCFSFALCKHCGRQINAGHGKSGFRHWNEITAGSAGNLEYRIAEFLSGVQVKRDVQFAFAVDQVVAAAVVVECAESAEWGLLCVRPKLLGRRMGPRSAASF